jgi:hypothetical protein
MEAMYLEPWKSTLDESFRSWRRVAVLRIIDVVPVYLEER